MDMKSWNHWVWYVPSTHSNKCITIKNKNRRRIHRFERCNNLLQWIDLIWILIWQPSEKEHMSDSGDYMNTHWIFDDIKKLLFLRVRFKKRKLLSLGDTYWNVYRLKWCWDSLQNIPGSAGEMGTEKRELAGSRSMTPLQWVDGRPTTRTLVFWLLGLFCFHSRKSWFRMLQINTIGLK